MTLKRIFIFLLAVGVVFSCGKEPQKESVKIITTNITVPSLIEIEEGQDITLQLRGITNISTDDRIVLRNAAGNDTPCSIVDYKDGSHLSFALPEGFTAGHYKLYIRSGGLNNYAGEFDLSIIQALNVEPEPGVTVYGMVECGGKGVPDVLVSDGAEIVKTDKNGIYQLKSEKKWKYVFVIIPTGYEVPNDGILPRFHQTLSQSATVAERKDFELIKVDNDEFTMLVAGDMHLAKRNDDISQFAGVAKTMNEAGNAADLASGKKKTKLDIQALNPRVTGAWPGDYCQFKVPGVVSKGKKVRITFETRTSATNPKYWKLIYLDGNEWKAAAEIKTDKVEGTDVEYTHAMNADGATNVKVDATVTYSVKTENVVFRFVCQSAMGAGGDMLTAPNGGTWRLAVTDISTTEWQPRIQWGE